MAGKHVSDGADAILTKAGSLLEKAAASKPVRKEPQQAPVYATYAIMPPAQPLPEVVPEVFRQIKVGLKRDELLASVGKPSSRITIPGADRTVDSYRDPA